jgi:phosphate butyryltransferase
MQPTVDAQALTEMNQRGEITGCEVYGPLSMDLAIDPEAAVHKGISNPVAGNADILLFPNIDAGNITYKMLVRTGIAKNGNLLVGTTAPVILTSRSDDTEVKVNSIALAACVASAVTE